MTIPTDFHARMADMVRIGRQAARQAQERHRALGIPNWYSLGGRIVSDVAAAEPARDTAQPSGSGHKPPEVRT